ncbi:MAG: DUF1385 domain-containing protein [Deltaproteobacteria bacterium]|nr:DUF1385 domain-containing protein [Deltaproteobacteria bacterium]NIS78545.1 DUF1385 domain-containing protein [Deltaproteobacteria bacterium]
MNIDREFVLGGQAVIEGVMMKGGDRYAVAVRSPSGGIVCERFSIESGRFAKKLQKTVFLRGLIILFSMLVIGLKALNYSAAVATQEEEKGFSPLLMGVTVIMALCLALVLFFLLPFLAGLGFSGATGLPVGGGTFNLLEGGVRILVFLLYIGAISYIDDIRRVFEYHGAEHKVVNAYEDSAVLEASEVMRYPRFHPRCGTSFILFLLCISIVVFSLVPAGMSVFAKGAMRIVLLPIIAGISYEFIRLAGKRKKSLVFRLLSGPGMLLQKITTREPDVKQVEVALASLSSLDGPLA